MNVTPAQPLIAGRARHTRGGLLLPLLLGARAAELSPLRVWAHRPGPLSAPLAAPYHRPFELGSLVLELLPAGRVLGSAQLRVIRENGERVVYTGDLSLEASLTAERAQVAECDTPILESTFGHPRYVFPPRAEVWGELERWVRAQLERGAVPVVLAYPLGKSQEAMARTLRGGACGCARMPRPMR